MCGPKVNEVMVVVGHAPVIRSEACKSSRITAGATESNASLMEGIQSQIG